MKNKNSYWLDLEENEQQEIDSDADDVYVPPCNKGTKRNANILFTTGLGFSADNQSQLQTVIESARNKKYFRPEFILSCLSLGP
jgi:hypothetical protein